MNQLTMPTGTRLRIAKDVPMGQTPEFNLICTFARNLDDSAFLISIPMVGGVALELDEMQKFLIRYNEGSESRIMAAYPDAIVKEGIRRFWKMRRVADTRQFYQRKDERYKLSFHVNYYQPTWQPENDGSIAQREAMTLDISAGGLAVYIDTRYDVGEMLYVTLPRIGLSELGAAVEDIVAVVCWNREAPKGSRYRYVAGLQFRVGTDGQKEQIANYISNLKKVYKL